MIASIEQLEKAALRFGMLSYDKRLFNKVFNPFYYERYGEGLLWRTL